MNQGDYLKWCNQEFDRSRRWRHNSTNNFDESWKRYSDLYSGKHYDRKSGTDQLTVNMIFATINVMAPAVAIHNPRFTVNARTPESAPQAVITEEVLNFLWRTYSYQRDFRLSILDWLIMGHGWMKVGYKWSKTPEVKKTDAPVDVSVEDAGEDVGIDDREDRPGNTETEMIQEGDRPYLERISPFDMFVDPDARHPKELRWIAQRTWRSVQDVSVDSRYSATSRKKVTGSSWSRWSTEDGDARHPEDKPQSASKLTYAEIIEFYDIKKGKVSTFARNSSEGAQNDDGFLIKPEKMPYESGHPFVMMRNYEVPDTFYPMGDVQQIESLQLELNETRNQMLNYRKKFRRAWLYAKDMFDRDGIAALESEDDNVMIPVMGDGDPAKAITPVPPSITPPEFFDQSSMISNDIDRISGVSDYQRGAAQQQVKRTATEAAMIQDASNARAQDRLAKVEGFLADAGERVIQLMQQYVTGDQVARVVTIPVNAWFKFDADRIKGQFDYEVVGGSTEPTNETFRRQSAMQLVDASAPFLDMGVADPVALYMKILRDGFGEKDPGRYVSDQAKQQGVQEQAQGPGQPPPQGPPPGMQGPPPGMQGPPPGMEQGPPPGMPGPQELTPDMFAQMAMQQGGGGAPPPMDPAMAGMDPAMMQQLMAGGGPPPTPEQIPPELLAQLLAGGSPIS